MGEAIKTVAIIQARVGSTRLPNKVLEVIHEKRVIDWVISRIKQAPCIDEICLAIPYTKENDILQKVAEEHDIDWCIRGPDMDVLDRFVRAAKVTKADTIVRITADCPMIDPDVICQVYADRLAGDKMYPYVSTSENWPDGLDCEVFTAEELCHAGTYATLPSDREHVTPFIKRKGHGTVYEPYNHTGHLELGHHRWTVDEPKDLEFLRMVFPLLPNDFRYPDVLRVLEENPELMEINAGIERNEGYKKSVEEDK